MTRLGTKEARRIVAGWETDLRSTERVIPVTEVQYQDRVRAAAARPLVRERLRFLTRPFRLKKDTYIITGMLVAAVGFVSGVFYLAINQPPHDALACNTEQRQIKALDKGLVRLNDQFAANPTKKLADTISTVQDRRDDIEEKTWDDC